MRQNDQKSKVLTAPLTLRLEFSMTDDQSIQGRQLMMVSKFDQWRIEIEIIRLNSCCLNLARNHSPSPPRTLNQRQPLTVPPDSLSGRHLHDTAVHPKRLHRRVLNTPRRPRTEGLACTPRTVRLGIYVDDAVHIGVDVNSGGRDHQIGASACVGSLEPAKRVLADAHVEIIGFEGPVGSVSWSEVIRGRGDGDGEGRDGEWESHFVCGLVLSSACR